MKTLKELTEARRNPEQNPVEDSYEQLLKYRGNNDIFITYTSVNKVGINPYNDFKTPTAIYTYPLNQMWKLMDKRKNTRDVPFAGNRKFIQVVKLSGKGTFIHDLHTRYSKSMYDKDMEYLRKNYGGNSGKLEFYSKRYDSLLRTILTEIRTLQKQTNTINQEDSVYKKMSEKGDKKIRTWINDIISQLQYMVDIEHKDVGEKWEKVINNTLDMNMILDGWDDSFRKWTDPIDEDVQLMRDLISDYGNDGAGGVEFSIQHGSDTARVQSWGGKFWNVTRWVSCNNQNPEIHTSSKTVVRWNKILRELGYTGMADRSGKGIIHPGEPTQAIFLSKSGFKHVDTIYNKQVKKIFIVKNIEDIRNAVGYVNVSKYDLNRLLLLITTKRTIKNFKDVRPIINDWVVKNYKKIISADTSGNRTDVLSWIAHEDLFKKIKTDIRKRVAAYLYIVNPVSPFQNYKAFGLRASDKEDRKIIENIAKHYKLGSVPKNKRFSTLSTWALDRMEKQDKMSKKEWDKFYKDHK